MFAGRVLGMAFRKVELLEFYFREARLEHQPTRRHKPSLGYTDVVQAEAHHKVRRGFSLSRMAKLFECVENACFRGTHPSRGRFAYQRAGGPPKRAV